ncbi:MAG: NAD(P)/FAD-dependent oxidoreductase [Sinomicrobium sp.]|nr:NAD(P)/FAD-dependent oxidoreductase [Sinomicrobium sp.]
MFDALILGGGAAGMQCALVLGSAHTQPFAANKKTGIIMHQRASHLQSALFNNVLGLAPGTTGAQILQSGKEQLAELYPHIVQIENEKAIAIHGDAGDFTVTTNAAVYRARLVVVALGYTRFFDIDGLNQYIESQPRTEAAKERIRLRNSDHVVKEGIYVAGTLAGWRSQFAIASGSGAQVATDILTLWNGGKHTKIHDKTV